MADRDIQEYEAEPVRDDPEDPRAAAKSRAVKDQSVIPEQSGGALPSRWR